MADKNFSTNIDSLALLHYSAFLDGKARDESADIVINNLGAALAIERKNVKTPADAGRIFLQVSGDNFYEFNPFLFDFFVNMHEKGRQHMVLSPGTVLASSMKLYESNNLASKADLYYLVTTHRSCYSTTVVPKGRMLERLADMGWGVPGCTRPIKNQAVEAQKTAFTRQRKM